MLVDDKTYSDAMGSIGPDFRFEQMESEFGLRLPCDYREVIADFPLTGDGQEALLYKDLDTVIVINRKNREEGYRGCRWPAKFFVIGGNTSGDLYFLDLGREVSPVFAVTHEMDGFDPDTIDRLVQSASFRQWVEELSLGQEWFREVLARRSSKQWWQFWI